MLPTEVKTEQPLGDEHWWITRSPNPPDERKNGWVLAWIVESYYNEEAVARATGKLSFKQRMADAGMADL